MNNWLVSVITMAGGLGCFLLGMKHLSEGLQSIGGAGLKKFMSGMTTNRFAGVATGMCSTMIVQSSSIITVMAVGFVSSGLMNLTQAINVIIGSNIGTTVTGWIIAYAPDVEMMGLSLTAIGAVMYFGMKREGVHNGGLALLGLGLVFVGLFCMNKGLEPVKKSQAALDLFATLDATTVGGLMRCFIVSLVFTALVQSSSATTAIVITLANQGVITFPAAAATVFGMNVGTTVTAWLAAIDGSTEARRTAMAHTLFNVTGTVVLMPLFVPVVIPLMKSVFPNWQSSPAVPIAAVHTGFNVITTMAFLPFVNQFSDFVRRIVKERKSQVPKLVYLDSHMKMSPLICCGQAYRTMLFMADSVEEMMSAVKRVLAGESGRDDEDHVFHREDVLDNVQCEITQFLGKVMSARLPVEVAEYSRTLLRAADEFESLSDEFPVMVKAYRRLREAGGGFAAGDRVFAVLDAVGSLMGKVNAEFRRGEGLQPVALASLQAESKDIRLDILDSRERLLRTIGSAESEPLTTLAMLDIYNAADRMRSCIVNIAETLAGGKKPQ